MAVKHRLALRGELLQKLAGNRPKIDVTIAGSRAWAVPTCCPVGGFSPSCKAAWLFLESRSVAMPVKRRLPTPLPVR